MCVLGGSQEEVREMGLQWWGWGASWRRCDLRDGEDEAGGQEVGMKGEKSLTRDKRGEGREVAGKSWGQGTLAFRA